MGALSASGDAGPGGVRRVYGVDRRNRTRRAVADHGRPPVGVRRHLGRPVGARVIGPDLHLTVAPHVTADPVSRPGSRPARRARPATPNAVRSPPRAAERGEDGLAGTQPEQVRTLRAEQRGGARPVVAGREHQVAPATDHREGPADRACLPPARPPRPARRRPPGRSRPARCRSRRRGRRGRRATSSPAAPTARSVWPSRQVRPAVSVTTTATLAPDRLATASRRRRARGVGVLGEQDDVAGPTLEASTPAAAIVRPSRLTTIDSGPAAGDHATGLGGDRGGPVARDHPALGLADDLAGHADDVAVGEVDHGEQEAREVVAAPTSPTPSGDQTVITGRSRDQIERRRRHRGGGLGRGHQQGTARQESPASRDPATSPSSTVSTSQPSSTPPADRAP